MHQNMKNFYELLDIKKNINIFLSISPIIDVNPPRLKIDINKECLYDDILEKKINFNYKIDLLEKIDIKIKLYNKNYRASQKTALILDSLKINVFEIIPKWTQLASYHNDHNVSQPTNYLGFNGTWNLKIDEPFYRWKHKITGQGWLLEPYI